MTDATKLPPLPEPFDYCYEWDGPYGTRKFSTASHNGRKPERSVPLFNADQMHACAEAARAPLLAEIEALRKRAEDAERDAARYLWLRDGCNDKHSAASHIAANCYGMEWDAEIDAAIKGSAA